MENNTNSDSPLGARGSLEQKQCEFVSIFNDLDEWADKFNYLIALGDELPPMPGHLRTPQNQITGCQSRTYFSATYTNDVLHIYGCSNAAIPAGLITVMRELFQGSTKLEIQQSVIDFHTRTGLIAKLSHTRADALLQMIARLH